MGRIVDNDITGQRHRDGANSFCEIGGSCDGPMGVIDAAIGSAVS